MSHRSPGVLTLIASSDLHGRFLPSPGCGSMAAVAEYAARLRERGHATVTLDCGDMLTDSPQALYFALQGRGRILRTLIDRAGYDAVVPGNHDLALAPTAFPPLPAVVCNAPHPFGRPYAILRRGGMKIAVTGAVSAEQTPIANGTGIYPPAEKLRETIREILSLHRPDLLVGLIHAGREETEEILRQIPEFDIAFYGHDHRPAVFATHSGILAANPGKYGEAVARFTIADGRRRVSIEPLEGITPSPALSPPRLCSDMGEFISTPLATAVTPGQLEAMLHATLRDATGAQVTAIPRADYAPYLFPLSLSPGTIYRLMPYDDYPCLLAMTGKQLKESGLQLMVHERTGLDEGTVYTVGADSHTLRPTGGIDPRPLQRLLFEALAKQADKQV